MFKPQGNNNNLLGSGLSHNGPSILGNKNSARRASKKNNKKLESFLELQQDSQGWMLDELEIAEEDIKIVENFLDQFTIVSESSNNEHLDIVLFLKAIPVKVASENVEKIELFNFKIF